MRGESSRVCDCRRYVLMRSDAGLDLDSVDLDKDEWSSDVSNVTSVLKLWLRELPDPLLTSSLHNAFLDAAGKPVLLGACPRPDANLAVNENERLRHIRLHERVNDLPDPNYSTLKYFMGHLHKCAVVHYSDFGADSIVLGSWSTKLRTLCRSRTSPSFSDRLYSARACN